MQTRGLSSESRDASALTTTTPSAEANANHDPNGRQQQQFHRLTCKNSDCGRGLQSAALQWKPRGERNASGAIGVSASKRVAGRRSEFLGRRALAFGHSGIRAQARIGLRHLIIQIPAQLNPDNNSARPSEFGFGFGCASCEPRAESRKGQRAPATKSKKRKKAPTRRREIFQFWPRSKADAFLICSRARLLQFGVSSAALEPRAQLSSAQLPSRAAVAAERPRPRAVGVSMSDGSAASWRAGELLSSASSSAVRRFVCLSVCVCWRWAGARVCLRLAASQDRSRASSRLISATRRDFVGWLVCGPSGSRAREISAESRPPPAASASQPDERLIVGPESRICQLRRRKPSQRRVIERSARFFAPPNGPQKRAAHRSISGRAPRCSPQISGRPSLASCATSPGRSGLHFGPTLGACYLNRKRKLIVKLVRKLKPNSKCN